jgi:hypothetical protein
MSAVSLFPIFSRTQQLQQRLTASPIPYEDPGACPFECCTYREWTVEEDTVIRQHRTQDSPVAFEVKKGEIMTAMTGVVITTKAGLAKATHTVKVGDKMIKTGGSVQLLTEKGEGIFKGWYRGKIVEVDVLEDFEMVQHPEYIWWVKLKSEKGQIGWSNQPEHFGNKDACG